MSIRLENWDAQRTIRVFVDLSTDDIEVSVEAPVEDSEVAAQALEMVTSSLGIAPIDVSGTGRGDLRSVTGHYYVPSPVGEEWLEQCVESLRSLGSERRPPWCVVELFRPTRQRRETRSIEEFEKVARDTWGDVLEYDLHVYPGNMAVQVHLDPRRAVLDLTVDAESEEEARARLARMVEELSLDLRTVGFHQSPGARSSEGLRIELWNSDSFADALSLAVEGFTGSNPVVHEASVVSGEDTKRIEQFDDVKSLISRLAVDPPYSEVHLHVEGPKGVAFSARVEDGLETLWIRDSFDPPRHRELVRTFRKRLKLKHMSTEESSDPETPRERSRFITATLPGALVGFVLTSAFWANVFPKFTIGITVPLPADTAVHIPAATFPIEWVETRSQWFRETIDRNATAAVRVLTDGFDTEIMESAASPGIKVSLPPGRYVIEVRSLRSDVTTTQEVLVLPPR